MEKRTLLAVVLSVIVISGSYLLQSWLAPPAANKPVAQPTEQTSKQPAPTAETVSESMPATGPIAAAETEVQPVVEERVAIETNLVKAVFSNRGGDLVSYQLKEHKDGADYLEMVLQGTDEAHAFTVAFGAAGAPPLKDLFNVRRVSDRGVEFFRDYQIPKADGGTSRFRLTKRYEFRNDEYLFELAVSVDGGYDVPALDFNGTAYTLEFGPQIGPKFEKLSQRYEYRNYYTYANGKRKQEKINNKTPTLIQTRVSWAAIAGKYFTFMAIPDATQYSIVFANKTAPGINEGSQMSLLRPALKGSKTTDLYRFYLGPKTQRILSKYDDADKNSYKLNGMDMTAVANTSGILGPLEVVLKWLLMIFYQLIPNYGVAIILLTIIVKVIMFPLTKKGSESTLRMQALSPKIKEIQDKFRDNPTKMNAEMAELYKREGYNPMSGCLPMILQIPIFFAMYNLFNNHFDLRGALFIAGWIPDLSLPETIWSFAPFKLPILNWSDVRLLPFLYLGSQLLYGKVTQTPDQQGNAQMKMMLYVMPIMFFFILYDVPSGLLLYWIMSNLLTMVQQLGINKYLAQKKAHLAATTGPVIAPKRKKK